MGSTLSRRAHQQMRLQSKSSRRFTITTPSVVTSRHTTSNLNHPRSNAGYPPPTPSHSHHRTDQANRNAAPRLPSQPPHGTSTPPRQNSSSEPTSPQAQTNHHTTPQAKPQIVKVPNPPEAQHSTVQTREPRPPHHPPQNQHNASRDLRASPHMGWDA